MIARCGDVARGAVHSLRSSEVYLQDRREIGLSVPKRAFLEYFEARSQRQFKEVCDTLQNIDLSDYGRIVIYSYWFFVMARIGVFLKEKLMTEHPEASVILCSRAHGYDVYDYVNSLNYLPLRSLLLSKTDMVFPCSENGSNYIRAKFPEYSGKIRTSYLGSADNGVSAKSSDGVFRIVSCSRIEKIKRVEMIVEALALLEGNGLRLIWTHIGDGEGFGAVEKLAKKKLGFMEYELLGRIDNSEVYEFYRENPVDLFVNVSRNEGLPVSIMEASSFGIPSVATDVGGTGEIVKDGINGTLLSRSFKPAQLADVIREYTAMPDEVYEKRRLAARNIWKNNFNAADNYEAFSAEISTVSAVRLVSANN